MTTKYTYDRQYWLDRLINTETGETIQDGTRFTARRFNHIEEGIFNMYLMLTDFENEILHMRAKIETGDRVADNNGIFVDTFDGLRDVNITLDTTKTTLTDVSGTNITIQSVEGFTIGQEITVASTDAFEVRTITAINTTTKVLTLNSALTQTFSAGSIVARSTVEIDTAAKKMKRGGIDTYSVTISVS